jgi:hypothetical protein
MIRRAVAIISCAAVPVLALGMTATVAGAAKKPVCKGKTEKAAIAAITDTWSQVLDYDPAKTAEERFAAIEGSEDPEFRAVLEDILAKNASFLPTIQIEINEISCTGKKEAEVLYDLVISDVPSPGLAGPGTAVLVGSEWRFSQQTVCDLFALADPTLVESGPCADIALGG